MLTRKKEINDGFSVSKDKLGQLGSPHNIQTVEQS